MPSRPLTKGEVTLARSVFGDAIEYDRVTITDGQFVAFQPKGTAMAPEGNLYMYGCYQDDFSTGDVYTQGHFIHEMTHVWQFQNKVLRPIAAALELNFQFKFNYLAAYDYKLDGTKDLLDFNMEQQASIVQDHFVRTHGGKAGYRGNCVGAHTDADKTTLYQKTLAKFLQNPAYAKRDTFPKPAIFARRKKPPGA